MSFQQNPFVDLYVTESISADTFVKVFSTALLDEADTLGSCSKLHRSRRRGTLIA